MVLALGLIPSGPSSHWALPFRKTRVAPLPIPRSHSFKYHDISLKLPLYHPTRKHSYMLLLGK